MKKEIFKYGIIDTPFEKKCFFVFKDDVIYILYLVDSVEEAFEELKKDKYALQLEEDNKAAKTLGKSIFSDKDIQHNIKLGYLKGTDFQKNVWKHLCNVSFGTKISYSELAKLSGNPKAVRATASAVAKNQISYIIPCHRIVRTGGDVGKFRWGSGVKREILAWELENR